MGTLSWEPSNFILGIAVPCLFAICQIHLLQLPLLQPMRVSLARSMARLLGLASLLLGLRKGMDPLYPASFVWALRLPPAAAHVFVLLLLCNGTALVLAPLGLSQSARRRLQSICSDLSIAGAGGIAPLSVACWTLTIASSAHLNRDGFARPAYASMSGLASAAAAAGLSSSRSNLQTSSAGIVACAVGTTVFQYTHGNALFLRPEDWVQGKQSTPTLQLVLSLGMPLVYLAVLVTASYTAAMYTCFAVTRNNELRN